MIPHRACSSLGSLLTLILLLTGCGGDTVATRPTPTPTGTATPAATATAPPPTDTPTVVPTATTPPPTGTPTVAPTATATPAAENSVSDETSALTFRTIPTSDGFVAVREQPTTGSSEITRLTAGSAVVCTGFVVGESLLFGGQYSDQWAECPSVGGYIFGPLLTTEDAPGAGEPPATAPDSDTDAIIAATRAHVGNLNFTYEVTDICVDGDFATATVAPEAGAADPVRAVLQRVDGSWTVIHFQPGMPIVPPGYWAQLGVPDDFACFR